MRKKFAGSGRDKSRLIFQMLQKNNMQVALALLENLECKCSKCKRFFKQFAKNKNIFRKCLSITVWIPSSFATYSI
jgi:hypothetical protein